MEEYAILQDYKLVMDYLQPQRVAVWLDPDFKPEPENEYLEF